MTAQTKRVSAMAMVLSLASLIPLPATAQETPAADAGAAAQRGLELYQQGEFAAALVQPPDTGMIIAAARRAGVPFIKLERDPYEPVAGDFRIRPNSMLMLGHSAARQVIDGAFAIERAIIVYCQW